MAPSKTVDRSEPLDPEVLDQLFATIGQSAHKEPSRPPQPTVVVAPTRERPLGTYDSPRPVPRRRPQTEYTDQVRSWRDWLPTVWLVGCLLVAGFCFLMGMPNSPLRKTTVGATVAKYVEQPRVRTRDIQHFDVGMRSAGSNPLRDQVETAPEPHPETSRKLVLRMKKESGLRLDAKLLRSVDWIEAVGAKEGGTFFLDLPEMGAVGDAYVEAILPCPPIEKGPGNVVTGVFAHEADPDTVILSVTFANGAYIKGVTDNHPFFSVDRNDFVEIGKMHEGDYVKVNDGVTRVTKIESRFARPGEMLYNLETHNEHVYQVTTAGILVHNSCVTLYKAPQRHYDVQDIARNGLRKDMFPGEGAFFTTDPKIAHKYARNYQNGVHEFRVSRAEYDRLVADGKIVLDPNEVNSLIVRPNGIDALNSATTSRRWIDQLSQDFWNLFGAP